MYSVLLCSIILSSLLSVNQYIDLLSNIVFELYTRESLLYFLFYCIITSTRYYYYYIFCIRSLLELLYFIYFHYILYIQYRIIYII